MLVTKTITVCTPRKLKQCVAQNAVWQTQGSECGPANKSIKLAKNKNTLVPAAKTLTTPRNENPLFTFSFNKAKKN